MPEGEFLDLICCPYLGQGKKDDSQLRTYINERSTMVSSEPTEPTKLNITLDRLKYKDNAEMKKSVDPKFVKSLKIKKDKEEKERRVNEEQRDLLLNNGDLAQSIMREKSKDKFWRVHKNPTSMFRTSEVLQSDLLNNTFTKIKKDKHSKKK